MPDSAPFRILHVDTGREWRGGQGQVLALSKGLRDRGVEQILALQPGSPLAERAAAAGLDVRTMRMRGEFDFFAARRLRALMARESISLVHAHDAHAHSLAWMATRRLSSPVLVVSRRVDFSISRNWLSRRKYLDPRVRYLAISSGVRDVLVQGGVAPEAIALVPSGVDPGRFKGLTSPGALRLEFSIEKVAPIIGTIGSLVDHKDHRCLLDAAPAVLDRYPNARFIIVGEGPLRSALEARIAELGLVESVLLPGYREDLETFLAGFDVFALSSHLEGLCTSLIDAMLLRLPAVGTRTGGVPDLIRDGETGLLVKPKRPAELAGAILRLLEDRALAERLAEAGRAHALNRFTADSLVENTLAAYEAIRAAS